MGTGPFPPNGLGVQYRRRGLRGQALVFLGIKLRRERGRSAELSHKGSQSGPVPIVCFAVRFTKSLHRTVGVGFLVTGEKYRGLNVRVVL